MFIRYFATLFVTLIFFSGVSGDQCSFGAESCRILYNHDLSSAFDCVSPFNPDFEKVTVDDVEKIFCKSIDEVAGYADAVMFSPGLGWVPCWKSKVLPFEEHLKWQESYFGKIQIDERTQWKAVFKWMRNGGDFVDVFVKQCHSKNMAAFISYRLNDAHHNINKVPPCKFFADHPDYTIGKRKSASENVHNWAIPEAREYKLSLIRELCENYDIDGIELDFMRHWSFFRVNETSSQQRIDIMSAVIKEVRKALDNSYKHHKRYLCIRIPDDIYYHDRLGIDVRSFVDAGVDMVNLSNWYTTSQQQDISKIEKMIPNTPVFFEITHTAHGWRDIQIFLTDNQILSTAYLAYKQGAQGISLFNFPYFREFGSAERRENGRPFYEPPFYLISELREKDALSLKDQVYFSVGLGRMENQRWVTDVFTTGKSKVYGMDIFLPKKSATEATLRLQVLLTGEDKLAEESVYKTFLLKTRGIWEVKLNGSLLKRCGRTFEPFKTRYTNKRLGEEKQFLAYSVPLDLIHDGKNDISVKLLDSGESDNLIVKWVEISVPVRSE